MKKFLLIILIILLLPLIFFYDSETGKIILFFSGLLLLPILWFVFCFQYIKANIKQRNKITKLKHLSSIILLTIFTTLFIIALIVTIDGWEQIGVVILYLLSISFIVVNIIIQNIFSNYLNKHNRPNKS